MFNGDKIKTKFGLLSSYVFIYCVELMPPETKHCSASTTARHLLTGRPAYRLFGHAYKQNVSVLAEQILKCWKTKFNACPYLVVR